MSNTWEYHFNPWHFKTAANFHQLAIIPGSDILGILAPPGIRSNPVTRRFTWHKDTLQGSGFVRCTMWFVNDDAITDDFSMQFGINHWKPGESAGGINFETTDIGLLTTQTPWTLWTHDFLVGFGSAFQTNSLVRIQMYRQGNLAEDVFTGNVYFLGMTFYEPAA